MPPKVASSSTVSTASTNVVNQQIHAMIIKHIAVICSSSFDSTMMNVIPQQGWAKLSDVTTLTLAEVSDLTLLKDDGTYWDKPLAHHLRKLK
jgi:hypothetical protein